MLRRIPAIVALFALVWLPEGRTAARQAQADAEPDELIVTFAPTLDTAGRSAVLRAHGASAVRRYRQLGMELVRVPAGTGLGVTQRRLQSAFGIVDVQPNHRRRLVAPAPPNDPFWLTDSLWGLQKIGAPQVWAGLTTGDASIVVADIDTGANYTHPDLAANIWTNPLEIPGNGVDDDLNGYIDDIHGIDTVNHDSDPFDDQGHGTHTAGTIAGVGNNGIGVVGVTWNATVLPCKFLDAAGNGTDAGAIECFDYLLALKARGVNVRVTNNSWGGARGGGGVPTALKNAFDALGAAGIINIVAAGNDGTNNDARPFDPASLTSPSIVAVAASTQTDTRASFSNYGATSVDLAAPGVGTISTYLGTGYASASGTSMATPHVAGASALLLALDPTLSVDALKALMLGSVDVLPAWGGVVATGGRLNVFAAASAIAPNTPPTVALTAPAEGASFTAPATIGLTATASDADGTVTQVQFFANGTLVGTDTTAPYAATWSGVAAGTYALTARATDNDGATRTSATVNVTVTSGGGGGGLPSPWTSVDIGAVGAAGSASEGAGVFTVRGAGGDIWGTVDGFQFVYQPLTGDGTLVARVASLDNTHFWAKAGLMIREGLTASARHASIVVSPTSGLAFVWRAAAGSVTTATPASGGAPEWVRLERSGSTIQAYQSEDGVSWTPVGSTTVSLGATVYVGLAVTSHVVGTLNTATFDAVSVTGGGGGGGGGNTPPTVALTAPADGASFAAPATIGLTATASDADGTVTQVQFFANGTLVGTDTTAPYAATWSGVAAGTYALTARATDNGGAMTTSATATVTVTGGGGGGGGLPSPWTSVDIGAVGAAGSASEGAGVFTVRGAGGDIWGTVDGFQFVYQPLTGDGTIVARVASLDNTHFWAKAGLMIREGLTASARHASIVVSPTSGLALAWRATPGGVTNSSPAPGGAPEWVRLERSGSTIQAYQSEDGVSWTPVGSTTVSFGATVYVGLAVTSHVVGTLNTATFDNLSVSGGV